MRKLSVIGVTLAIVLSVSLSILSTNLYAQAQITTNNLPKPTTGNGTSISVNANVGIQVSNATVKSKEGLLRSAVVNFLVAGPNVLKTSEADRPAIKTKIINQISNDTQNVEGSEATNAIIGVEISKALKTLVSSSGNTAQVRLITLQTSSICKPVDTDSVSCDNVVTIK